MIDDQFLASGGRPTDSGFAQPEVLANLCCRQGHVPNRPVGQNTTGETGDVRSERAWLVLQLFNIDNRFSHLINIISHVGLFHR